MKILWTLFIALALAAPAAAQVYPPELAGVQFEGQADVLAYLDSAYYCPWSIPEDHSVAFAGEATGTGGMLTVQLACLVRVATFECIAPAPLDYTLGRTFYWNTEALCYLELTPRADGLLAFEAWTVHEGQNHQASWMMGCLDIEPGHPIPSFKISQECPLFDYWINPAPERLERLLMEAQYE